MIRTSLVALTVVLAAATAAHANWLTLYATDFAPGAPIFVEYQAEGEPTCDTIELWVNGSSGFFHYDYVVGRNSLYGVIPDYYANTWEPVAVQYWADAYYTYGGTEFCGWHSSQWDYAVAFPEPPYVQYAVHIYTDQNIQPQPCSVPACGTEYYRYMRRHAFRDQWGHYIHEPTLIWEENDISVPELDGCPSAQGMVVHQTSNHIMSGPGGFDDFLAWCNSGCCANLLAPCRATVYQQWFGQHFASFRLVEAYFTFFCLFCEIHWPW